ncbi:hypothetical protein HZB02_01955 [Candidatus Woesearchaeota archaeon]|nr:hypothetical protein [Candidatus Woesearchaeota archaeon]
MELIALIEQTELYLKDKAKQTKGLSYDFSVQKGTYVEKRILQNIDDIAAICWDLCQHHTIASNRTILKKMLDILQDLQPANMAEQLAALKIEVKRLKLPMEKKQLTEFTLPAEIKKEVETDLQEMNSCYENGCYRSAIFLCGKILETALHRKYFEATNKDLLETSPNLGLGKIIAKMKEANINLGIGIDEQIHLINKLRVESVHKRQDVFIPTKEQAQATMLYTTDVLGKLW